MLLDEFLLSPFVILPSQSEGSVTIINPRSGTRSRAVLEEEGVELVDLQGTQRELRHFTLGTGTNVRHLWYTNTGRLMRIELPSSGITAVRVAAR
jgi:hypothetical protein